MMKKRPFAKKTGQDWLTNYIPKSIKNGVGVKEKTVNLFKSNANKPAYINNKYIEVERNQENRKPK